MLTQTKIGEWEIGSETIPDLLYELRDRQVILILAPVDDGDPVRFCGICGLFLSNPGEPCPRCVLISEDVAAAIDAKRVAESAVKWLKAHREPPAPHPLEVELEKFQKAVDALEERPPLWWADKLLWRGLQRFCRKGSGESERRGTGSLRGTLIDIFTDAEPFRWKDLRTRSCSLT